jgi:hypothetical protein
VSAFNPSQLSAFPLLLPEFWQKLPLWALVTGHWQIFSDRRKKATPELIFFAIRAK